MRACGHLLLIIRGLVVAAADFNIAPLQPRPVNPLPHIILLLHLHGFLAPPRLSPLRPPITARTHKPHTLNPEPLTQKLKTQTQTLNPKS